MSAYHGDTLVLSGAVDRCANRDPSFPPHRKEGRASLGRPAADLLKRGLLRIVVADASAIVEYLLRTEHAEWIGAAISDANHYLHVPASCDVKVTSALRRALQVGALDERRVEEAVEDYLDLPLTRHGHQSLVVRMLELRNNFSAYDATYVALTELLGGDLLTGDLSPGRCALM
jgi:predicted nucleic acid-binding protein